MQRLNHAPGVGTLSAAGIEVLQESLAETQGAIQVLVPWLDPFRWVFIAVALAGIGLMVHARPDHRKRVRR